jgi:hypothetical protein
MRDDEEIERGYRGFIDWFMRFAGNIGEEAKLSSCSRRLAPMRLRELLIGGIQ